MGCTHAGALHRRIVAEALGKELVGGEIGELVVAERVRRILLRVVRADLLLVVRKRLEGLGLREGGRVLLGEGELPLVEERGVVLMMRCSRGSREAERERDEQHVDWCEWNTSGLGRSCRAE